MRKIIKTHLPGVVDIAKKRLRLPARIASLKAYEGVTEQAHEPEYAVVVGLISWALEQDSGQVKRKSFSMPSFNIRSGVGKARGWVKNFLP